MARWRIHRGHGQFRKLKEVGNRKLRTGVQLCMRTITLEEHFVTQSFLRATNVYAQQALQPPELQARLLDLGQGRIEAMDQAGIDLQVLSLAAIGFDSLDADRATGLAHEVNQELAEAVRSKPARLAGFATLALKDVSAAAAELDRCVTRLGFCGALVNGTTDGRFLDDARYLPFFEAAAHLGVPVYLHPAPPPGPVQKAYFSGLQEVAGHLLSIAGWGWHAETGLHTLRLIVSGLFDRLPDLQLIIGHMGEGLPYALARSGGVLSSAATHLIQPVADYFQTNIHITTSGYFTLPPFRCALDVVGADRLLYSVDYPFSPNMRGRDFLQSAASLLDRESLEKLTHRNAQALLKFLPKA